MIKGGARLLLSFVLAGSVVACTDNTNPPGPEPSGSTSATVVPTTSVMDIAKSEATEAYESMWRDMEVAATTSDWRSPRLAQHATADALPALTRSLQMDNQNGVVTKGELKNDPRVTEVDPPTRPTTVMIYDCSDTTNWLKYRVSDDQLVDDVPGGRQAITAEVQKQADGLWRVTRFAVEGVGSCS
jgi:hypothetical protein